MRLVKGTTVASREAFARLSDSLDECRLGRARGLPPPAPAAGRDVPVTRPEIPSSGTAVPFFIDWVSVTQEWPEGGLPTVDSGCVWAADADGVIEWRTVKSHKHCGSFDTSLQVRCDGHRVTFSGNVSRFGRADNVFGFDLAECLRRINGVLAHYGLPPFSAGERIEYAKRGGIRYRWTGARFSRLDLTANYQAGSADNAHLVMQYLGSQHNGRKAGRVLADGETVDFGKGSRRQYWKAYVKHKELKRHGCSDARLVEWCESVGLVRFEGTIKSNALNDLGCAFLGDYERGWAMGQLVQLFAEHSAVLSRAERATDDLDDLPARLRAVARDYLAGMDMKATLSKSAFYRHRVALLPLGIDLSVRNVRAFAPRVRVVQLAHAEVPSWYQLAA